jgi:hypothetical protein
MIRGTAGCPSIFIIYARAVLIDEVSDIVKRRVFCSCVHNVVKVKYDIEGAASGEVCLMYDFQRVRSVFQAASRFPKLSAVVQFLNI